MRGGRAKRNRDRGERWDCFMLRFILGGVSSICTLSDSNSLYVLAVTARALVDANRQLGFALSLNSIYNFGGDTFALFRFYGRK